MQNTTVKKSKSENFTQVHNKMWTDMNLTGDGLRVLGYLLSKKDGWVIREGDIRNQFAPIGKDKASNHFYRKTIKNIQDAGYLKKVSIRNELGHIVRWETHISDEPIFLDESEPQVHMLKSQHVEKPTCGEFTPLNNTDSFSNTDSINNTKNLSPPTPAETLALIWLVHTNNDKPDIPLAFKKHFLDPSQTLLERVDGDVRHAASLLKSKFDEMKLAGFEPVKMGTPVKQILNELNKPAKQPHKKQQPLSAAEIALQNAFGPAG